MKTALLLIIASVAVWFASADLTRRSLDTQIEAADLAHAQAIEDRDQCREQIDKLERDIATLEKKLASATSAPPR
jgi:phage shock protein A